MTEDNLTLTKRFYEARERDDREAVLSFLDPEIEARTSPENPDQIVERGHEGFERFIDRWGAVWEDYRFEPQEYMPEGNRVLVLGRARARSRGSSVDIQQFVGHLWTLRGGKAIELRVYHERDEALAAAGLG